MCHRRVTAPISQTTMLELYFPVYLKLLNQSLIGRFKSIYSLLTSYLIATMGSAKGVPLAIFSPSQMTLVHPLLSRFAETFSAALDISKAFDRVWHKSLLSKIPSFGFYPSLRSCISSFLSSNSISAVVHGHCFPLKPISSGVPKGSVSSPNLILLFINDILSITNCPIHS